VPARSQRTSAQSWRVRGHFSPGTGDSYVVLGGTVWLVARVAALVPPCGPGQASAGREPRLAQDQDDRQDQQHRAEGDQGVADAGQLERAADTD
jgi:hypothetical protein